MLWIVDGGMLSLPVEGRVEDWRKGEWITVTHGKDGEWTDTVTYEARGECHDKNGFDPEMGFECVECGATTDSYMCSTYPGIQEQLRYCPLCGRKVVSYG